MVPAIQRAAARAPSEIKREPITLGVAEPFITTFTVAFYAAVLLGLPFMLYQAYAFIVPAFSPRERGPRRAAAVADGAFPVLRRRDLRLLRRPAPRRRLPADVQQPVVDILVRA